jgi:hypothetical protein
VPMNKMIDSIKLDIIYNSIKENGIFVTFRKTCIYLLFILTHIPEHYINKRRLIISNLIFKSFEGVVHYGLFKGLILDKEMSWSTTDKASMLLGLYEKEVLDSLYEKEVLDSLSAVPNTHRTFIDIGAADGYYGIGVLVNNLFDYSYCFEMSEYGQKVIARNANLNGVSHRLKIFGIAEQNFIDFLNTEGVDLSKTVLLCDIEGGEFKLFNDTVLNAMRGSVIIIETHDSIFPNGRQMVNTLKQLANNRFSITEFTTTSRDLSLFPELNKFNDNDRWLIVSEGRRQLPSWIRLDPK